MALLEQLLWAPVKASKEALRLKALAHQLVSRLAKKHWAECLMFWETQLMKKDLLEQKHANQFTPKHPLLKNKLEAQGLAVNGPFIQGPEGGGLANGSGSDAIFFTDPNGVCFEINTGAMTVAEYHETKAETGEHFADA